MLLIASIALGFVLAQDRAWPLPPDAAGARPASQEAPPPAAPAPAPLHGPDGRPIFIPYLASGAIEAPRQPVWASSSSVVRTERPLLGVVHGRDSEVMVRVRDLVDVRGQESNQLQGVGIVTGLNGTGDSGNAMTFALKNLLSTQNINLDPNQIASNNVAVVWVQAMLPPGVKPGRRIDARVSSIYDADDLTGGSLVWCELLAPGTEDVYATASGPISTGAFSAGGESASASRNHPTIGICSQGCKVEREVPSELVTQQGFVHLDLKPTAGSFGNAVRIARALEVLYPGAAIPIDAMTVKVAVPKWLRADDNVLFIDQLLEIELVPEASSKVVVNERTGVVILGEEVRLSRGAITKGNLTITIAETPETSQPGAQSGGETETLSRTELRVEEEDRRLSIINGASTLQEVVEVLNVLGVTPRDMVDILQSMSHSGILHGDLVLL